MNEILKKIDVVLEEGQARIAELVKKQGEADSIKSEYLKKAADLVAKERQLDVRAEVIAKYENIDMAIESNNKTSAALAEWEGKLNAKNKDLEKREKKLADDKKELDDMVKSCKEKDKRLDDAKAALEVAKSEMQDKILEEIKKKLLK